MDTYNISMFSIYLAVIIFFWIGFSEFIRISYINRDPEALLKIKKQKLPRIPFACIACMYLYLLTAALRLFLFQDSLRYGSHIFDFISMFTVICILSGLNLITVQTLYSVGMGSQVKKGWIALKLAFLPFWPLNAWLFDNTLHYIDSDVIGYALLLIVFWPFYLLLLSLIPLVFPIVINVANGCIGISYIRQLRLQTGNKHRPSGYHFGPQMIPGLDLISILFILIKYRKVNLDVKSDEPDSATALSPYVVQSPYAVPFSYADRSPHAVQSPYAARSSYADRSPYTVRSPYTSPSPYAYKAAPTAEPKIYKKLKKHRKLLFLLYLTCGILFYFKSEIVESVGKKYEEITAEETTFYEMTDEETALMQNFSRDAEGKEKVAAGQLTSHQAELLENLRIGYSYIESKYPDGQLQIERMYHRYNDSYYIQDAHTTVAPEISYYTFSIVPVQQNGRKYQMKFSSSPDSVIEDNLYAYLQEDSYFRYIEEQLAGEVPGFAKLDTNEWYDWYITEYENPDDLTVEAVLGGEYLAGPRFVDVYIAANGKTPEECKQQEEVLNEIFRRIELPVERYTVRYYDLTVQEILVNDLNSGGAISAFSIHGNLPEDSP